MNTERPDNDDAARGPEDRETPKPQTTRDAAADDTPDPATGSTSGPADDAPVAGAAEVPAAEDGAPEDGPAEGAVASDDAAKADSGAERDAEGGEPVDAVEPVDVAEPAVVAKPAESAEAVDAPEAGKGEPDAVAPGSGDTVDLAKAGTDAETDQPAEADAAAGRESDAETDPLTPARADAAEPGPVREAAVAAESPAAPEPADGTHSPVPDEPAVGLSPGLGHDEGGRRRSPVLVASVAAAVLLVGGGGAYLAAGAGDGANDRTGAGSSSGDRTPPPLVLDDQVAGPAEGTSNGIAPGEPNPYGVTYRADGDLPDGPASAPVYWAKGEVTQGEVTRLATALGVQGAVVAEGPSWRVGTVADGSGPVLRVAKEAPGLWTFSRYTPGTDNCKPGADVCMQTPVAPDTADPVSEAVAKKAAAPVLKAVGQDDAKIDASQVLGAQRVVNAEPEVGGLPVHGWTTGVTVSGQGEIVGGSGQLKEPAEGAAYPVMNARETLDRLNAASGGGGGHRMGIGGCASPVPAKDRLESPCKAPTDVPKRQTVTVDDAVFGLAPHASGGRQVLVPSWMFSVKGAGDDYTVAQPAIDPKYLKAPSAPSEEPPSGSAEPQNVKIDGYTAEGTELVVGYTGGVCSDYKATAVERGDEVEVKVTATPWPDKVCIKIAKFFHQTVKLDAPLGDRTVVGTNGENVPLEKPGARLPR